MLAGKALSALSLFVIISARATYSFSLSHLSRRTTSTQLRRRSTSSSSMDSAKCTDEYGSYNEGYIRVHRNIREFCLYYRIYNPDALKERTPILCVHGGPGLPSQYMYPISKSILPEPRRSIIFFDQLGCGKSDQPDDFGLYSTSNSIKDMAALLKDDLEIPRVHLLGHSYGGGLAYDFTHAFPQYVQSLILSNAPTTMKKANDEYDRLHEESSETFWSERVCRTQGMPPALEDSLKHVSTIWGGMDVVIHYAAEPMANPPPAISIVGEHDFGVAASAGWPNLLSGCESVVLENCAHYPFLEGQKFGNTVSMFCAKHDET